MPFTTLNLGLTLTIPTNGTRNWGTTMFSTTWTKISQHQHTGSGDGNRMITASYTDNSVTTAKLSKNIGATQNATVLTPVGTSQAIDFNDGNIQLMTLASASGDVTLTFSNPAQGSSYKIFATQGATPRNLIWPAAVLWPQGQDPILSVTNGAVDVFDLYYNGTNYMGQWENDIS